MNYINPPEKAPQNVEHNTFYSQILQHEIGYNIYLPPCYKNSEERYPVVYHLHGWTHNESTGIWPLEKVYQNSQTIMVFVNVIAIPTDYLEALRQIESILIDEMIPHIDGRYRTDTARTGRGITGFSMGGNMAFYIAVKHAQLFGTVIAYAGTYHHLYHKDSRTVGEAPEKAVELYQAMMDEERYLEENNILWLVRQNAEKIRGVLNITIHIGTADILFCDNEIMHLYLNSLNIPHAYKKFEGVAHELEGIV